MDSDEEVVPFVEIAKSATLAPKRGIAQKPASLSLEAGPTATSEGSVSMEERFENESYNMKVKHWKESPFAVGLTEITWADKRLRSHRSPNNPNSDDQSLDSANCLCFSAHMCPQFVVRVGNMSVLSQSTYSVEELEEDENGEVILVRILRPKLDVVVGPYWPMLCFVTYPLILGISGWALVRAIPGKPFYLQVIWFSCTIGLIGELVYCSVQGKHQLGGSLLVLQYSCLGFPASNTPLCSLFSIDRLSRPRHHV